MKKKTIFALISTCFPALLGWNPAFAEPAAGTPPATGTPPAQLAAPATDPAPEAPGAAPEAGASKEAATAEPPPGFWDRPNLFGDMGGLRTALGNYGITLGLQETSEYFNNVSGGLRRGGVYNGLTQLSVDVDADKALGWKGGHFFVSALQIHGRDTTFTQGNLGSLQTVSSAEANPATRLWELWYQQSFLDGKVDVKIGQQSLDQEFIVSPYGGAFISAMFGWPALPSIDLPAGGPAYPLSSLGVRLRVKASDSVTVLGGIFDGNPAGSGTGDPQKLNRHGTNFNLHDSALLIAELQYAVNPPPANPADPQPGGLPGTYKIGAWYHSGQFADPRFDTAGLSLANPASSGLARQHRGDYSIYATADQMVWRAGPDSPQSVSVFARLMGAPGDRNLVDVSLNAGIMVKAPFKGRDNDTFGIGMGYAKLSSHARGLDRDTAFYTTPGFPVRSGETFVEATYQYQVTPWWQLQGDVQYLIRPSGGVLNPNDPGTTLRNEWILGIRTNVVF